MNSFIIESIIEGDLKLVHKIINSLDTQELIDLKNEISQETLKINKLRILMQVFRRNLRTTELSTVLDLYDEYFDNLAFNEGDVDFEEKHQKICEKIETLFENKDLKDAHNKYQESMSKENQYKNIITTFEIVIDSIDFKIKNPKSNIYLEKMQAK